MGKKAALVAALVAVALLQFPARAGNPGGAAYSPATDRVFWFVHFSDTHIRTTSSQDSNNLLWMVTTAKSVIDPEFMVASGDLTDSTSESWFGLPAGPYQEEWDEYKSIVDPNVDASFYYDFPGNHDAYNDRYFAYYKANSVQGRATGQTQVSWTRQFDFGKYHFLGVNTADNSGDPFSLLWPWGDYAGLDASELAFIDAELDAHADADLTMVFGHHPITDTGGSGDTWLYYGVHEFVADLDSHHASLYGYGHTHAYSDVQFTGNSSTGIMTGGGVRYLNINALGKDSPNSYDIVAVDCNGVSSVAADVGTWPVVLITAPVDRTLGATVNPYAYSVPAAADNPVRALVFDAGPVSAVQFRIDSEAVWHPMSPVPGNPKLWQGLWDASSLAAGDHTLTVQVVGTSTRSHAITVTIEAAVPQNQPPVAVDDAYGTDQDAALAVPAPGVLVNDFDPDGDPLTAALVTPPAHGSATLHSDGSFTYTPGAGYSGPDSFTYEARDGEAADLATVVVTVRAAGPEIVTILAASYNPKPKKLHVEATSSLQPDTTLTVVGYSEMSWVAAESKYVFDQRVSSPPGDSVTVSSAGGASDTYVFGSPTNLAPVADDQNVTVLKDTPKTITLTAADPNGDPLTYMIVQGPANGELSGKPPTVTYTPWTGYEGLDSFTFKATDGSLFSNAATVSITVSGSSAADAVAIVFAEYKIKAKSLTVRATSTLQPDVALTLVDYGPMSYDAASAAYVFSGKVGAPPGATVTVISTGGGTATAPVTVK